MPTIPELSKKEYERIELIFKLKAEGLKLLGLVVAEWESDPMSVQCFDLRVVNRAKAVIKELIKLDPIGEY